MSERNTSLRVNAQFPEFFREEYSLFVRFVSEYYNYLDTTYSGNIDQVRDIDLCDDVFLQHFRNTFCPTLPNFEYIDLKFFIKHAREFYRSKGTIDSVKFLFRALFNEGIEIFYPGDYLLKAQDGVWDQEYFISIDRVDGELPTDGRLRLEFYQGTGLLSIHPSRIEVINALTTRFYFRPTAKYNFTIGQDILIYDENRIDNNFVFSGVISEQPSEISVLVPGRYWIVGRVFKIRGTNKDTICRVTKVDSTGGIAALEILEYGHVHNENEITIIQPYRNRPNDNLIEYQRTLVSVNPSVYQHTLHIRDGIYETVDDFTAIDNTNTVVTAGYVDSGYFGTVLRHIEQNIAEYLEETLSDDVTIEQWLESRAQLQVRTAPMVKTKGRWVRDSGLLQNESIVLQDNDIFQAFQYSIETDKDISEYQKVIGEVHPAGFRLYSTLNKTFRYRELYNISRSRQYDVLFFSDSITDLTDGISSKYITKPRIDNLVVLDQIFKNATKPKTSLLSTLDPASVIDVVSEVYVESDYATSEYFSNNYIAENTF